LIPVLNILRDGDVMEWQYIVDYPIYKISDTGLVYNEEKQRFVKPFKINGLNVVTLYDSEHYGRNFQVGRLVAFHFIPNPNKYEFVTHIDKTSDDSAKNLAWSPIKRSVVDPVELNILEKLKSIVRISEIPNFPNYVVSEYGDVYNIVRGYKLNPTRNGRYNYLGVRLHNNSGGKLFLVHRLVAEAFVKRESNSYKYVMHIDGDFRNNHYSNLKWCHNGSWNEVVE
jgi:hypothetical protein